MKLLNSLFEIIESSGTDSSFTAKIRIVPDHIIYQGHFPGHPVTPGVIFIQMVHELLEQHLKTSIRLIELSSCKFLKIVNPLQDNLAQFKIELSSKGDLIHVKATAENSSGIFFKMNTGYKA